MNCFLSLRAYGLLCDTVSGSYEVSDLTKALCELPTEDEKTKEFARYILVSLSGTDLLKAIEHVYERGDTPTLRSIIAELNEMGYELSENVVYISTMRQWLSKAGLFDGSYKVAWDIYSDLTQLSKELVDKLYRLTREQKHFVISMLELGSLGFTPWPDILRHVETTKHLNYDMKMFPKTVLVPLSEAGILDMQKGTLGRGAKPNSVKLTEQSQKELLLPFLRSISQLSSIDETELNRSFESILEDLNHSDKHVKGRALELLAVWLVRLCSLRFTKWRKRDYETGQGEVDVMAASDAFVYSRWQLQCKNTAVVDVDVIAKEIGMTFMTNADVVMIVTTGRFTSAAYVYADRLCMVSRYYTILLDGSHLDRIRADKASIVDILNKLAKRAYIRREYGASVGEDEKTVEQIIDQEGTTDVPP